VGRGRRGGGGEGCQDGTELSDTDELLVPGDTALLRHTEGTLPNSFLLSQSL